MRQGARHAKRRRERPSAGGASRHCCSRAKCLMLVVPFVLLGWTALIAWRSRGGTNYFASSNRCFKDQDGGHRLGGVAGGEAPAGSLENIAHAYLAPERLVGGACGGRKVVAFAITLTKDGHHMDGAAVLAASIDDSCATSGYLCDLVAFLHDEVELESEKTLERLGFRVLRPGLPLEMNDIEDAATRERVENGGCCGPAELMKFFAYTLTEYHRVVHLDTDVLTIDELWECRPLSTIKAKVLQPLDPLLDEEESLLFTADVNMGNARSPTMPVQGGFLVIRPDLAVYDELVEVVRATPWTSNAGWGGSGIGVFWGGITVQGLLPYYYERRAAPENRYRAVDRCVYNNMVDTPECREIALGDVRSAHFTNCQKPWLCIYPHPKQPLCSRLFERWFEIRVKAEKALGLPRAEACPKGFRQAYSPMLLTPA